MKKILIAVLFLLPIICIAQMEYIVNGFNKNTAPFLQSGYLNSTTNGTSFSVSLPTTPTSGHLLVLIASCNNTMNIPSGWTRNVTMVNDLETSIYSKISAGTETSVTVTATGTAIMQLAYYEFATYTTFDKSSTNLDGGTSQLTLTFSATAATTAANEIVIAAGGMNRTPTGNFAPSTGWTNSFIEYNFSGAASNASGPPYNQMLPIAMKTTSSTGTQSTVLSFTTNGEAAGQWNALIATYK